VIRVLVIAGTRPEVIKLSPVVQELKARGGQLRVNVLHTGQHRELLVQAAAFCEIEPTYELAVMDHDQPLSKLLARLLKGIDDVLRRDEPDWVLVQGDTTTALAGALAAFHRGIPVGHVEAGLRSHDLTQPFPEEGNRRLISHYASLHFAPTALSEKNLLAEGVSSDQIIVTGNTIVDAVTPVALSSGQPAVEVSPGQELVLLTLHRRESFGTTLTGILTAVRRLAEELKHIVVGFPVHPNPNVRQAAASVLGNIPRVHLLDPLPYPQFVATMKHASVVLTDSGGVEEEAVSIGAKLLVLRDVSDRPEGVEAGLAVLVGTDPEKVYGNAMKALTDPRQSAVDLENPYGDGKAARRIVDALLVRTGD